MSESDPTAPSGRPEPDTEPYDRHDGPLDDPEDARYLHPDDPRRVEVERRRGRRFRDED